MQEVFPEKLIERKLRKPQGKLGSLATRVAIAKHTRGLGRETGDLTEENIATAEAEGYNPYAVQLHINRLSDSPYLYDQEMAAILRASFNDLINEVNLLRFPTPGTPENQDPQ